MNRNMAYGLAGFGVILLVIALIFVLKISVPFWLMAVLAVAAMVALVAPVAYVKRTEASFDGVNLIVKGSNVDLSIDSAHIRQFDFRDNLTVGNLVEGSCNGWMTGGVFKNDEFGEYTISADADQKAFIVVRYSGKILVFNLKAEEQTREFYDSVRPKIDLDPRKR